MKELSRHKRINDIVLGSLERPALQWLAAHMPAWMTPDMCTVIGVLGALMTLTGYVLSNQYPIFLWLASFGFLVNWFGDSLDGTLARHRHIERPRYGYFVDHAVDLVCQVLIFVGLGLSPYVNFHVASLALVSYILLAALIFLRTHVAGEFKISYGGLGPTESRAVAVVLNTGMYFLGQQNLTFGSVAFSLYDIFVAALGVLLLSFFINTAVREGIRLAKLGE